MHGRPLERRLAWFVGACVVALTGLVALAGAASVRAMVAQDQVSDLIAATAEVPSVAGRVEALVAGLADPRTDPERHHSMRGELASSAQILARIGRAMRVGDPELGILAPHAELLHGALAALGSDLPAEVLTYADAASRAANPEVDLSPGALVRGDIDGEYPLLLEHSRTVVTQLRSVASAEQNRWTRTVRDVVIGLTVIGLVLVALLLGPFGAILRRHRVREEQARQSRDDSAAYVSQLLDGLDVAVLAADEATGALTVNGAARTLHGLPAEGPITAEDLGTGMELHRPGEGEPIRLAEHPLMRALQGRDTAMAELVLAPRAGRSHSGATERRLLVRGRALRAADGRILGAVSTEQDLTEQHARNRVLARHAAQLAAIGRATNAVLREDDARTAVCRAAVAVAGAVLAGLFEDSGLGTLVCTAATGADVVGMGLPVDGNSMIGSVFATARSRTSMDIETSGDVDQEVVAQLSRLCGRPLTGGAWVPVVTRGRCVAVLGLGFAGPADDVAEHLPALEVLAAETAVALERQDLLRRLSAEAESDGLTGAANRRAWETRLPGAVEQARRTDGSLTVLLLDLDHFKGYNDRFGHPAGDALLREAVTVWRERLRPGDVLARYGGEEFAVLLPGCTSLDALAVAESLRSLTPSGQTCSAGLATWNGLESAEELVARADAALYAAKQAGRDRTSISRQN